MSILSQMQTTLAVPAHLGVMGDPVVYTQTSTALSVPFSAIVSNSLFQVATDFGVREEESRDFMFPPASLDFGWGPTLPQRGDVIAEGGFNYVVTSPQGFDFYSLDSDRIWMTVHTKKKS